MKTKIKMNRQQAIAKINEMMGECDIHTLSKIYDAAYGGISVPNEELGAITATLLTAKTHDTQKLKILTKQIKNTVPERYTLFGIKTAQGTNHIKKIFERVCQPSQTEMLDIKKRLLQIQGVSDCYFKTDEEQSQFHQIPVYKLVVLVDKNAVK
jgi:hypothetical protein